MTTEERLTTIAENVAKVYEAGKAAAGPGFTPPTSEALDPDEVYRTTRPADWLPMPTPGDGEIYLLGMIYEGIPAQFGIYAGYQSNGSFLVEIGNLVDGVFVAKDSFVPTSKVAYIYDIPADDYGDITADGFKQYMVRITGNRIASVSFHNLAGIMPDIVDCISGMPNTPVSFGSTNSYKEANQTIRYIRFVGNGYPGHTQVTAGYCTNLLAVSCEREFVPVYYTYAFVNCKKLMAISPTLANAIGSFSFFGASALIRIPANSAMPDNLMNAFRESGITEIDGSNFGGVTIMQNAFYYCSALRSALNLNISSATNLTNVFAYCYNLRRLTFSGDTTPGGTTIDITASTRMSHTALVEMINSLPTATAAATITLTGIAGAAELTDDEIAVATARNWTITI